LLERKADKEIKRQHATTEAAANMATDEQTEAHEAAIAAYLAHQAMAAALAARATHEEAIDA
jgi:flagellar hook-basal body complex protein FliE